MWDNSVDTRPASNCAFIAPAMLTQAELWKLAKVHFPMITARLATRGGRTY